MGKTAYLVLENGKTFRGQRFGAAGEVAAAEVVFTTGMTGYLEACTDRGFWGQIAVHTFPQIGNYGVIPADFESDVIGPRAYIVKHWCQAPSNFRCEGSLDTFFQEKGVIGLCGIDTRALTKILREKGVMNGAIVDDPALVDFEALRAYRVAGAIEAVSVKEPEVRLPQGEVKKHLALLDFGRKDSVWKELVKRGAKVTICPYDTTAQQIKDLGADGVVFSNGPGDPREYPQIVENVREIVKLGLPMLGIDLGHLFLAMAHGGEIEKLKYGHRGGNQPVRNTETGRIQITSQGHSFAVKAESLDLRTAKELFVNVNDGTCEGVRYLDCSAFSVQFHPEASAGPLDTIGLFDEFFVTLG